MVGTDVHLGSVSQVDDLTDRQPTLLFTYSLSQETFNPSNTVARSIACESLVCAGSIAYDLIVCRVIASDQDSLDIIG